VALVEDQVSCELWPSSMNVGEAWSVTVGRGGGGVGAAGAGFVAVAGLLQAAKFTSKRAVHRTKNEFRASFCRIFDCLLSKDWNVP
jgi:hypothetical protein